MISKCTNGWVNQVMGFPGFFVMVRPKGYLLSLPLLYPVFPKHSTFLDLSKDLVGALLILIAVRNSNTPISSSPFSLQPNQRLFAAECSAAHL